MKLNSIMPWKKGDSHLSHVRTGDDPLNLLQRRMNHLFDDFFGGQLSDRWGRFGDDFAPQIDISETSGELRISAELPGLDEKDVEVTLTDNVLTLKGEKKEEHVEDKEDHYHSERSYGYFERAVQLPDGTDTEKAKAKFKKGVLEIAIPKKPEAQTRSKKIELESE